jgi:hypothetical protein
MTDPNAILIVGGCIYIAFAAILAASLRLDRAERLTLRAQLVLALLLAAWPIAAASALALTILNRLRWCKR